MVSSSARRTRAVRSSSGAVVLRCALALPIAAWAAFPLGRRASERAAFAAGAMALLATISWVSHSGSMGTLGFVGDLMHLAATASWSGALLALAVMPVWSPGARLRALVGGVSRLGLAAFVTLMATGTYMATLHMYAPLRASVRAETLVLAGVLLATALLATRPPAHERQPSGAQAGAAHPVHGSAEAVDEGDRDGR